jgi:methylated-DNA-[protein]-cysteine S-methyltransferase
MVFKDWKGVKMRFRDKVYLETAKIPRGKVSTYKTIAKKLNTKAYRAVGTALNKNPHAPKVPCHRVINSSGHVGDFSKGIDNKISLLKKEGIKINQKKIDLEKFEHKL